MAFFQRMTLQPPHVLSLFFVFVAGPATPLLNESLPLKMFVLPAFIKRQNAVQSVQMVPPPPKQRTKTEAVGEVKMIVS